LAGYELSFIYLHEKNYAKQIEFLRKGAKLGDAGCVFRLVYIYKYGEDGQIKDEAYGGRFLELYRQIDQEEPPKIIEDFDERFPPRPVVPYSGQE
jgi:hypothetical protein